MNEDQKVYERLAVMETKIDALIDSVSELKSVDSKATESLLISRQNEERIKEINKVLEDTDKARKNDLRLLWGAILTGVITFVVNLLSQ